MIYEGNKAMGWNTRLYHNSTTGETWIFIDISSEVKIKLCSYPGGNGCSLFIINKEQENYIGAAYNFNAALHFISKNYPGKEIK